MVIAVFTIVLLFRCFSGGYCFIIGLKKPQVLHLFIHADIRRPLFSATKVFMVINP